MSSIALMVKAAHPAAPPYFAQFPKEPIPKSSGDFITVQKVKELKDDKLTTLLDGIINSVKPGGDLLIISHGTPNGLHVVISRKGVLLQAAALRVIRAGLEGRLDDADVTQRLMLDNAKSWTQLKGLIKRVQDLKLNRVDLRACNVGKAVDVLQQLQAFFNCAVCCAPKASDVYGAVTIAFPGKVKNPSADWDAWIKAHPGATLLGQPPQRFGLYYKIIDETKMTVEVKADSHDAVINWMKRNLPPGHADSYRGGPLFYHGLTPDLKSIIFAGDERYRDYLVEAARGDAPVKVDPLNAPLER